MIRTVGLTDSTVLDASGLPHSDQMVLTERLRVLPDGRLENRMTIEDPDTFTRAWETVLTFHRDPAARVADDICPDRLARGEPAERVPRPRHPRQRRAQPLPAPAAKPAGTGNASPHRHVGAEDLRLPRAGGEARPPSGKAIVDRNAAAMAGGHIMQTAWTSCRPGAVSTMTMPRERILVLESPDEITILYEMPRMVRRIRMGGEHPADAGAQLRGRFHRPVGGRHAGGRQHRLQRLCRTGRAWPADEPAAAHGGALHALRRWRHRHRSDDHRSGVLRGAGSPSSAAGRRTRAGTRSSTTAWRTRGRKTSRMPTTCASSTVRSAIRVEGKGMELSKMVCER